MADDIQEIDLMKPGKLWATAEHQSALSFHLVMPKDNYTKDKMKDKPDIAAEDELMSPFTVPASGVDAMGVANFDLGETGRAAEVMGKLTEKYEAGQATLERIRGVVVAFADESNKIPDKHVVEVMDFKLIAIPVIILRKVVDYVTVQNFKGGMTTFKAEIEVRGPIKEVELSASPDAEMTVSTGQKGKGKLKFPVKEGEKYTVTLPVNFVKKSDSLQRAVPRTYLVWIPGGWRHGETDMQAFTREIWEGGFSTLTAAGTGPAAGVKHTLKLKAENWASDWLAGPPPPPFYHNNC
jgi:hypothetical protein